MKINEITLPKPPPQPKRVKKTTPRREQAVDNIKKLKDECDN